MHPRHESPLDTTPSHLETPRLDRRGLLRYSAVALTVPAALAAIGLPSGRVAAQSSAATPAAATPAASPSPAESGYAPVNGLNMYYEIHGAGQPLILLHGGLSTIDLSFGAVLPTLAQGRQAIAVELQGHGHTADIDRPFSYEAMADDIAALIAYLGLQNVDLYGFSLGGGVSWQTAIRHPELVRKLVIASAPIKRDGWYPQVLAGMAQMNAAAAQAMMQTPLYEAYARVAPKPEDWPALVTKTGQIQAKDYDWSDAVRAITAPTQIVIGDSDSVRPEHALETFRLLGGGVPGDFGPLPRGQFAVLPGTAHSALPGRADLLLPDILPFLDAPMAAGT
jgi:pimeloyl-ACP methyl ester carboxylesterase